MSKYLSIAFFTFILSGCSNKQLYQAGQDFRKNECIKKSESEQQHIDCLNHDKKSYENYEKERNEAIKK